MTIQTHLSGAAVTALVLWFSLSLAGSALASNSEPNPSIIQYATKNHINLRAEPNTQATVKGILMKGDAVAVKDATADWVYVFKVMNSSDIALAGETGFVHRSLLTNRFVERDKANDPALSKKLAEAEQALADAKGPLDMIPRALARSMAHDELDMAYVVQKSCVAQAEPVRAGHFVDLDGRSYFISNRGEVESEGERGTFAAYVTN